MHMAQILIVEDEAPINELICRSLGLVGHRCVPVFDGAAAVEAVEGGAFDLVLLDVMLPGLDGFQVFQRIRGTPTIFLTARGSLGDRVSGLTMGADDYLTKPFEMLELLARVGAVLRRTMAQADTFQLEGLQVDFGSRRVTRDGAPVELTPREFDLLQVLVRNRNLALSREKLLELAWGYDYEGDTRTVDVHIQKLRKKLGLEARIKTVYKLGYRLEA